MANFTIYKNGILIGQQEAMSAKGALALTDSVPDDAVIIELSSNLAEVADGTFVAELTE